MGKLIKGEFDIDAPGASAKAVTPSDSADLPNGPCRAIELATGGAIRLTLVRDTASVLHTLPAGVWPLRVKRVHAADLTASGIVAIY